MIYSGVRDNWVRLETIHEIIKEYYLKSAGTDFRNRMINKGDYIPIDDDAEEAMKKERILSGMAITWAVITVESFINHALAENINNIYSVVLAIEKPTEVIKHISNESLPTKSVKTEMARKLIILNNNFDKNSLDTYSLSLADEISMVRNSIVHDKPFDYIDKGDGEVEINYYRLKGEDLDEVINYGYLKNFYKKCDHIRKFVLSKVILKNDEFDGIDFENLVK